MTAIIFVNKNNSIDRINLDVMTRHKCFIALMTFQKYFLALESFPITCFSNEHLTTALVIPPVNMISIYHTHSTLCTLYRLFLILVITRVDVVKDEEIMVHKVWLIFPKVTDSTSAERRLEPSPLNLQNFSAQWKLVILLDKPEVMNHELQRRETSEISTSEWQSKQEGKRKKLINALIIKLSG